MTRAYSATRFPVLPGKSAWNALLADPTHYAPLEEDRTTDVVIIGAGIAGLTAARRLTQIDDHLQITVLDAFDIAESSSARNAGIMDDLPPKLDAAHLDGTGEAREMIGLNRKGLSFAMAAVEECGIDPACFDRSGKVIGAATTQGEAHNAAYANVLSQLDERCQYLDAQQMREMTGSAYYHAGLFTPNAVTLQPAGYVHGLARALAHNVHIHGKSPVLRIERSGLGWRVLTAKHRIDCAKVILANNGHLESFGIAGGRLHQLFGFASMTAELDQDAIASTGGSAPWALTPSTHDGTTIRRIATAQGGARLLIFSGTALLPDMRPKDRHLSRAVRAHRVKLEQRYPQLASLPFEQSWCSHQCQTLNGVSHAQEVDRGIYTACAQNGLGPTRATLTGITGAELALGQRSAISDYFGTEPEPLRLPTHPLRELTGNLLIRWNEWAARGE